MRIMVVALLGACSSSTPQNGPPDLSSAVTPDLATGGMATADLAARDLATSGGSDMAGRDLAARDLATSGGSDMAQTGMVPGQCWSDAHCPNGTCSAEAPGGICLGCGVAANDCPTGYDVCAPGAACSVGCSTADDCAQPSVQSCLFSGGDYFCALKSCSAGECGPLHECRGGFCRRFLCPSGSGCPAGTTCRGTATKVCVEDHLTFG